ncbi:hypothetical protein BGZ83_008893 [Gryganskiella cystojenkinii]|nr:hypothetical protein BGZ83_008893 [Gryganskiella cystojenkinii]
MAVHLHASAPLEIQGLPQPSDRFPYRYRNQAPLVLRHIVPVKVVERWSNDPEHVFWSLNQPQEPMSKSDVHSNSIHNKGETVLSAALALEKAIADLTGVPGPNHSQQQSDSSTTTTADLVPGSIAFLAQDFENVVAAHINANTSSKATSMTTTAPHLSTTGSTQVLALSSLTPPSTPPIETMLTVMVAEDTKNFMDNPQFTKKVEMSTRDIVRRVLVPRSKTTSCQLCDSADTSNTNTNNHDTADVKDTRFYYRGKVPVSLYNDLEIPTLLDSLSLPKESTDVAKAPNKDLMRIWVSLAGATTPLHYDRCHGILIQLVGRKRFVVFSHEETNLLYPYDGLSGPKHASKIRGLGHCFPFKGQDKGDTHLIENQEALLERWPRVKKASAWVIDLEPGDALYTPPGFWHEVTSVDHSVSVTVAWDMNKTEIEIVPPHMAF